jgi:short subunit dehydrogenase-like uncharacterized protein
MQNNNFLLYGANGYTGELIARMAAGYGLAPLLAGRSESAIRPLADALQLPYRVFDLNDTSALEQALSGVSLVVHAAGPFRHTAKQMVEACLRTKTHYLDINGDISVFEFIKKYNDAAIKAGIMLMPGVGFDVVPTDCIGKALHEKMPDATHLKLAFASIGGGLSHGTAMTMAEKIGEGGAAREAGKIVRKPLGSKGMWVDFGPKNLFVMSIPWGDISTAYTTTGIPNIDTFTGVKPKVYKILKAQFLFNWLLRTEFVRNIIKNKIKKRPTGPSSEERQSATGFVWGEATNTKGEKIRARLTGPEGYTLTAHSTLLIARHVLEGKWQAGYQTPAAVYGADLVLEIPGVSREFPITD